MNDTELNALTALVNAEIAAMIAENLRRARHGNAPAYDDSMMTGMDCVKCLDAELRRREVVTTPEPENTDYGGRMNV